MKKVIISLFVITCIVSVFSEDAVVEFNNFSTGFGNWKKIGFMGASYDITIVNGWARVNCIQGNYDDPSGNSSFKSTGCGLFYKAPAGDYTFETRFRIYDWVGKHDASGRSAMIRSDIDSVDSRTALWVCLMVAGNNLLTFKKDHIKGCIDPTGFGCAALSNGTGLWSRGTAESAYVRIVKTGTKFVYFCSSDSTKWTKVDSVSGGFNGYIGLIANDNCGWTDYDYVKVTAPSSALNHAPQQTFSDSKVSMQYAHGSLKISNPSSEQYELLLSTVNGKTIYRTQLPNSGKHILNVREILCHNIGTTVLVARCLYNGTTMKCISITDLK